MKTLQEPVAGAPSGEWWAIMEPVFHLNTGQTVGVHTSERARKS
jgi:hypothetical protein